MKSSKLLMAATAALFVAAVSYGADSASISGKITFDGTPPKPKKIKNLEGTDPKCAEMHADAPLMTEDLLVGDSGGIKDVFVYIKSGLDPSKTYDHPTTPVVLHQQGCHYVPHVFGMMAKQPLKIVNDDDTLHNIHAMPIKNEEFNKGQPTKGGEMTRTFANPEIMVHFKCDVHPWMSAYVGVTSNPFYSVSADDGTFSIKGLPAGEYEVTAWQEKCGEQTQKVKVGDGEAKTVDFKMSKSAE